MRRLIPCLPAILVALASVCQAQTAPAESIPSSPSVATPPDPVLASVNGKEIHASQVDRVLQLTLRKSSRNPDAVPADQREALRKQLLNSLVDDELLYQASQKEKIQVPEKAVDEQVQALEGSFYSQEEFAVSLQKQGMTPAEARERVRRRLAVEELVKQRVNAAGPVTDAEINAYYKKNRERLRRPESVHAQQIFLRLDPFEDPEKKGKARQTLEALLREIRGGKDFETLARQFSEGPEAAQGGDLGWLTRNSPTPYLAEAALRLNPGEVSDVVETPAGLHILKALEKRPAGEASAEEARSQIETRLRQEREQEAIKELLATLKTTAKILIFTPTP